MVDSRLKFMYQSKYQFIAKFIVIYGYIFCAPSVDIYIIHYTYGKKKTERRLNINMCSNEIFCFNERRVHKQLNFLYWKKRKKKYNKL